MPTQSHPNLQKPHFTSSWSNSYPKKYDFPDKNAGVATVKQFESKLAAPPVAAATTSTLSSCKKDSRELNEQPPSLPLDDLEDQPHTRKQDLVELLLQKQHQQQHPSHSSSSSSSSSSSFSTIKDITLTHRRQNIRNNNNNQPEEETFSASKNKEEECDENSNSPRHHSIQYRDHGNLHDWTAAEPAFDTHDDNDDDDDATQTVYDNHRKLLYLLSHPQLFVDAMIWQSKVDRGVDPRSDSLVTDTDDGMIIMKMGEHCHHHNYKNNGIQSFEEEFQNDASSSYSAEEEEEEDMQKNDSSDNSKTITSRNPLTVCTTARNDDEGNSGKNRNKTNKDRLPPLPLQIFSSDATIVLPQALTASQLFGTECTTGIELEATSYESNTTTSSIYSICKAFLRWLALMPGGDHTHPAPAVYGYGFGYGVNSSPTVMKMSGGRYRVVGAHRVVWRWMNKFSFPCQLVPLTGCNNGDGMGDQEGSADGDWIPMMAKKCNTEETVTEENSINRSSTSTTTSAQPDNGAFTTASSACTTTDFDFGDLVAMTIIDVFETDADGKLLSYCPTFDNRAIHKTLEVKEMLGKGAVHIKERMEELVVMQSRRHGMGKSVSKIGWLLFS